LAAYVGQCDGLKTAIYRVGSGEDTDGDQGGLVFDAGDSVNRGGAKPQDRSQIHKDVDAEPEHGHHVAHRWAVTFLQELGHGVDAVLEEDRQEVLADNDQCQGGHPLVRSYTQADDVAGPGHADDLFGGDVRRDQ
jgi:hypothetical protein